MFQVIIFILSIAGALSLMLHAVQIYNGPQYDIGDHVLTEDGKTGFVYGINRGIECNEFFMGEKAFIQYLVGNNIEDAEVYDEEQIAQKVTNAQAKLWGGKDDAK